jgi:hypothetical protein
MGHLHDRQHAAEETAVVRTAIRRRCRADSNRNHRIARPRCRIRAIPRRIPVWFSPCCRFSSSNCVSAISDLRFVSMRDNDQSLRVRDSGVCRWIYLHLAAVAFCTAFSLADGRLFTLHTISPVAETGIGLLLFAALSTILICPAAVLVTAIRYGYSLGRVSLLVVTEAVLVLVQSFALWPPH